MLANAVARRTELDQARAQLLEADLVRVDARTRGAFLLLLAAKRFEPLDAVVAQETIDAFTAALFAGAGGRRRCAR